METSQLNWVDRNEYPFTSHYFSQNGIRQHYIDEGKGEIILFVHGTPSWSFDFRNVVKQLGKHYRCVAVDHIGFGLSDKPADYDYSTQNHVAALSRFIEEKNLKNITLVLHDFGGPIGLEYALNRSANVKNLVVINSWIGSSKHDPEFKRFSKVLRSPLLPFLYLNFNFSPGFLLPRSFYNQKLIRKHLKQYTKPFNKRSERYGLLAFAHSLLNDQHWFHEQWNRRSVLADKNILLIWGMHDKFSTPLYLQKFVDAFPHARVEKMLESGHFPQEEQPEEVISAIDKLMKGIN